jgi:signal transduction histidine kinase
MDKEIEKVVQSRDKNFSAEVEHKILYADGKQGYILVRYRVIKGNNGETKRILGVNQDITKRKLAEQEIKDHRDNLKKLVKEKTKELDKVVRELKLMNKELSDKNKLINKQNTDLKNTLKNLKEAQEKLVRFEKMASLGILTAGVAHEMNNPLNYIMGSYNALESCFRNFNSKDKDKIDKLLDRIKLGLDKATEIVQGLNQFSRESKTQDEVCKIHDILENCLSILNNQVKYNIKIERQYADEELTIKGNVGQLHQAFMNILTNAIQAIPDKGKITLSTRRKKDHIEILITDTGKGISKENLSKVVDPFFTTKEPGKGTGLGLSITYSIIEEHKGTLHFGSAVGKGTNVMIKLPSNI